MENDRVSKMISRMERGDVLKLINVSLSGPIPLLIMLPYFGVPVPNGWRKHSEVF
jgi:hypothetical protein